MDQLPQIDILLATYNGERFVEEQIRSLLMQTYLHWRLIIRDDGSTDNTRAIIHRFKEQYPEKIAVIEDNLPSNLGACRNFGNLLERSTAGYTMFCDQDDVWLPKKIELSVGKMRSLEERYGSDSPLLVYTDMYVVNDELSVISDSFWRHQAFNPRIGKSLSRFLVSNVATGCTVMINRKLRELSVPIPQEAMMHDWWVGLISVALGENDYVREPTMLYRQHAMNVAGAKWDMGILSIGKKLIAFNKLRKINREHLRKTENQAATFASRYRNILSEKYCKTIETYANLSSQNYFQKRISIIRYGFWWAGFIRSLTMFVII
jgi:glycosyltransferase involved in cell wall biosynthesis